MSSEGNRKRLERQARNLMTLKEITAEDRDKINSCMRNGNMTPEEKYSSIIHLLLKAPDKEVSDIEELPAGAAFTDNNNRINYSPKRKVYDKQNTDVYASIPDTRKPYINGPTETNLYINDIYVKYRRFKLFKKRYLTGKDNWLGLGIRKRLIPAKKFMEIINVIREYQDAVMSRLPQLLTAILKDEKIESPVEFNYLRLLRRWMLDRPFAAIPGPRLKWMEQWGFDRELRTFTMNHYAFLKMDMKHRESLLALVEDLLRKEPDLQKEEISEDDDRNSSIRKEKNNYLKEKMIYDYLGAVRSFITIPGEGDSLLADELRNEYDIYSLTEFINMSLEALVFQRTFAITELKDYYDIRPAEVSASSWDCNPEKLKAYGKDAESAKRRKLEKLKNDLLWFDTVYQAVNLNENGKNIMVKSVEEQWKLADRINRDAAETLGKNFIVFVEACVHYFKNFLSQVVDGKPLLLEKNSVQREGALFLPEYFREELIEIQALSDEFFTFRSHNATLKISDEEAGKIMAKKISSMNHVETLLYKTGSIFYAVGKKLQEVYHSHVTAKDGSEGEDSERPVSLYREEDNRADRIPYAGYSLRGIQEETPLFRRIAGQKILSDSKKGGIYIFLMAYCYQVADMCAYPLVKNDLGRRDMIKREIREIKGEEE